MGRGFIMTDIGGHNDNSPFGTRWAFGPTELQPVGGMTYGAMRTVVNNSIGGFTEIEGHFSCLWWAISSNCI